MHRNDQDRTARRNPSVRLPLTITLILFAVTALPPTTGQSGVDATITLHDTAVPTCDCPVGWFTNTHWEPGVAAEWQLGLPRDYTVVDLDMPAGFFSTERPEQVVPLLDEPGKAYPLFGYFPRPDVWTTESHVRLFHYVESDDTVTLRLGIPAISGNTTATLRIERDVTAPEYTLGPIHSINHYGFHQNTTTDELAIGDLQWRPAGSDAHWIVNPTTAYHTKQIFPIQGMAPDTVHDVRAVFTDWAGNQATSDTYTMRTLPRAEGDAVIVTPLSPIDGAVVDEGDVQITAHLAAPDADIDPLSVRLFLDLSEVPDGFAFDGHNLTYTATGLQAGPHVISVEAQSLAGGTGYTRWTFAVAGGDTDATEDAPATGTATLALVLVGLALLVVRGRRN